MASETIRTVKILVVLFAQLRFIFGRDMLFLLELKVAMCESAGISELAVTSQLPVATHLKGVYSP